MGMCNRFEQAMARPFAAFHPNRAGSFVYTIGGLSTVMPRQGFKRPVGIRHHTDVAFRAR